MNWHRLANNPINTTALTHIGITQVALTHLHVRSTPLSVWNQYLKRETAEMLWKAWAWMKMLISYCCLPAFCITYAASSLGNAILFLLYLFIVCWEVGRRGRAAEEGRTGSSSYKDNSGAERKELNNTSKRYTFLCWAWGMRCLAFAYGRWDIRS